MVVAYLTTDDVEQLHERIIRRYGGASIAVREFGMLESAVVAPQQVVFDTELYPTLAQKAAILFFLLIQNHPFVDGNKRTAVAALERFLELNRFTIEATNDELFDLTIAVAADEVKKEAIADWISARMKLKD